MLIIICIEIMNLKSVKIMEGKKERPRRKLIDQLRSKTQSIKAGD